MKTQLLEATLQLLLDILVVAVHSVLYLVETITKTFLPDSWRAGKVCMTLVVYRCV